MMRVSRKAYHPGQGMNLRRQRIRGMAHYTARASKEPGPSDSPKKAGNNAALRFSVISCMFSILMFLLNNFWFGVIAVGFGISAVRAGIKARKMGNGNS